MADVKRQEQVEEAIGNMLVHSIQGLRRVVKVLGVTFACALFALGLSMKTASDAKQSSDDANRIACAARNTFYYLFGLADPNTQTEQEQKTTTAYKVYIDSQFKPEDCH